MKKQVISQTIILVIFLIGLLTMTYPFYVDALNNFLDQKRMEAVLKENKAEYEAERAKMAEENAELQASNLQIGSDPFGETGATEKAEAYYQEHLIGKVNIPKLSLEIPLYDMTNNELLERGATVLQGTSFPIGGESTHSVISGHRGLPNRELFTNIPDLAIGDVFLLEVLGETLAYEVRETQVVEPQDTDVLKIIPGKDLVTLLTCTPYMINSHRLLVTGERVPYTPEIKQQKAEGDRWRKWKQIGIVAGVVFFVGLLFFLMYRGIARYRLSKLRINLPFVLEAGQSVMLYDKSGKKPQMRNQQPYQVLTNEAGVGVFEDLPGNIYTIKTEKEWIARMGIKKKRQAVTVFKTNPKYSCRQQVEGHRFVKK